jgi:small subunit ribosomal protein S4
MSKTAICKKCRRMGVKLFLRGEKCFSPKCPMVKRPYPPGQKGKRRKGPPTEYALQLQEKQKLKLIYNLSERQFKRYVKEVLEKRGKIRDAEEAFVQLLEKRLDNVIFRLGFAVSRAQARQLVSHGFFLVNKKSINIPSYRVKVGDVISVKPQKLSKVIIKNIKNSIKDKKPPSWLEINPETLEGRVLKEPSLVEAQVPVDISKIFEFYSK